MLCSSDNWIHNGSKHGEQHSMCLIIIIITITTITSTIISASITFQQAHCTTAIQVIEEQSHKVMGNLERDVHWAEHVWG
jgi:hypothetical protein